MTQRALRPLRHRRAVVSLAAVVLACSPPGPVVVEATPARAPSGAPDARQTPPRTEPADQSTGRTAPQPVVWRSRTREALDLWLHGFGMLQNDSSLVPYFRRGYSVQMTELRRQRGVTTTLDANRERLIAGLATNPRLVSAQFVPLYFDDWQQLRIAFDSFVRAGGDPRATRSAEDARAVSIFATYFPNTADRDWARLFVQSLDDERTRFYQEYWSSESTAREGGRSAFDALWLGTYRDRFARFLTNSRERTGTVLLSLPLGGEGRTLTASASETLVAVPFPAGGSDGSDAIFVFTHEIVGSLATSTVQDQTSAADQRNGVADRYGSLAAVRAGALLLSKIAPELVEAYERFYLGVARGSAPTGPVDAAFASTFTLPANIIDALGRQIDIILGGI